MFYILISIPLFLLPYFSPSLSIPCSFIFLIPLIIQSKKNSLTFIDGFIWGLCAFSIQCCWFLAMVFFKGLGSTVVVLWIVTIIWLSLAAGVWFSMTRYSWFLSTVIFFLYITNYCLFPVGHADGYPFFNPLVPLCFYPQLFWCLKYIGVAGCLSCLVLFQICLVRKHTLRSLLCLIPLCTGLFFYQEKKFSTSHMHYIEPWWYGQSSPMFVGYRMVNAIGQACSKYQQFSCIVMPESTFCFDVVEYQHFIPLWSDQDSTTAIIFGGHRYIDGTVLNSFIFLQEGKVFFSYDKQHLLPFLEMAPKIAQLCGYGNMSKQKKNDNDLIEIGKNKYQVFICSELFFHAKQVKGLPIILIFNESWFCLNYMKYLAVLYINYFELIYDVPIIYASTQGRNNIN